MKSVPVQSNLIKLIVKETIAGVKYAKILYSGEIIGSNCLKIDGRPSVKRRSYLYVLKKAFSMHRTRIPNMQFMSIMHTKGRDTSPLRGESLGRIFIGPCKKYFVMPKELAIMLMHNVIRGRAWVIDWKEEILYP